MCGNFGVVLALYVRCAAATRETMRDSGGGRWDGSGSEAAEAGGWCPVGVCGADLSSDDHGAQHPRNVRGGAGSAGVGFRGGCRCGTVGCGADRVTEILEADAALRDRVFWHMLYESSARAEEVLRHSRLTHAAEEGAS